MINAKDYWDSRYSSGGDSGYGSYDGQLTKKLHWLDNLSVHSIFEIGCGDFNFGSNLLKQYPSASYTGYDISDYIIDKNKRDYPYHEWIKRGPFPDVDLTLCIDVLFHVLDDNEYSTLLINLHQQLRFGKYLAVTAYEYDTPKNQEYDKHIKHRKFDYKSFGEPLIREVIEEDGQLMFYLFKNDSMTSQIDLSKVSCCLNTKDSVYPQEILDHLKRYNFGEVLIRTNSDSPHRKYELFEKAKFDTIYYQDDDAICPVDELASVYKPDIINVVMKAGHARMYKDTRMTMGLGWGCLFPKKMLASLKRYTDVYGEDEVYKRETERILTSLNYPQNRIVAPVRDLPSAMASDRLWRDPNHTTSGNLAEERCTEIINKENE
jgi:hypothetical protein